MRETRETGRVWSRKCGGRLEGVGTWRQGDLGESHETGAWRARGGAKGLDGDETGTRRGRGGGAAATERGPPRGGGWQGGGARAGASREDGGFLKTMNCTLSGLFCEMVLTSGPERV